MGAAAGVPWIGFRTFRHTCASRLLAGGKNIAQVARWLGHADPAFTLRTHVHLMDDGLDDAELMAATASHTPGVAVEADAVTVLCHTT